MANNELSGVDPKKGELIVLSKDPLYHAMEHSIEIVRKYLIEHGLVLYGGTAIDYALRLRGDHIYPDDALKIPDLDFLSATNVTDAYKLADLLYDAGYKKTRVIVAQHVETMRVDLEGELRFVADVSYRPQDVLDSLPTITYSGMKLLSPDFLRVDLHSALSYPYDNPPREVVFARWTKDISRFAKIAAAYPLAVDDSAAADVFARAPVCRLDLTPSYVLAGDAALGLYAYQFLRESTKTIKRDGEPNLDETSKLGGIYSIACLLTAGYVDGQLVYKSASKLVESVNTNPRKFATVNAHTIVSEHYPYINLYPKHLYTHDGKYPHVIANTKNELVGVKSIKQFGFSQRVVSVQYLLKMYISQYIMAGMAKRPSIPAIATANKMWHLTAYCVLLSMIAEIESQLADYTIDVIAQKIMTSVFFPSVSTYGFDNINFAREVALNRLLADISDEPRYPVPVNYYPGRSREKSRPPPTFDPNALVFFKQSGERIADSLVGSV